MTKPIDQSPPAAPIDGRRHAHRQRVFFRHIRRALTGDSAAPEVRPRALLCRKTRRVLDRLIRVEGGPDRPALATAQAGYAAATRLNADDSRTGAEAGAARDTRV